MSTYQTLEDLAAALGGCTDSLQIHRFALADGHGLASGGECAHAVFRRLNDATLLWLTVTPSMAVLDQWQYSVSVLNGRELAHGHLRFDRHHAIDDAITTLWRAFRGEITKTIPAHA